jgi:hypothetical protein
MYEVFGDLFSMLAFCFLIFPIVICSVMESSLKNKVIIYLLFYISWLPYFSFNFYFFKELDKSIFLTVFCFLIFINVLRFIFLLRNGKKFSSSKFLEFLCVYFNLKVLFIWIVDFDIVNVGLSINDIWFPILTYFLLMSLTFIICLIVLIKRKEERDTEKDRIERLKKNEKKL